jgi:hypothetical protein
MSIREAKKLFKTYWRKKGYVIKRVEFIVDANGWTYIGAKYIRPKGK